MKKTLALLLVLLMLSASGCGKKQEVTKKEETNKPVEYEEVTEIPDNEFCKMMAKDTRPVAVMIDNDSDDARPQIGLESAYMVYEIIVEGSATRLMALFKDHNIEKVGPIRSSRHYFLDFALEHDAIYCHAGWSPKAEADIPALGVNNINGILGGDGTAYWRDNTYDNTWHNLYSGVDKLYKKATEEKGYRGETDVKHNEYYNEDTTLENGETALDVSLPYSGFYKVSYKYDSNTGLYTRFINGKEHMSQNGNPLTAKNIIIYNVTNYDLNDGSGKGRQEVETVGSGSGYYVTNGKFIEITWSKASRKDKTIYKTADGNELKLNPGNTYVQIIPNSAVATIA